MVAPFHRVSPRRPTRRKVAVLAWDVGHNPLGRAYILADLLSRRFDVEIWGAQFERYGSRMWAPLRDSRIPIHSFDGHAFPAHLRRMEEVAGRIDADAIWVSKPRLPSFALGILAKEARNRPLVLDVDDHELAFFGEQDGLGLDELERQKGGLELSLPFERAWTRACDRFIREADELTVSNVALQERYGGIVVPHARNERIFDPQRYQRTETRRRLGVSETDRLLLFGGTPRAHKGIVDVLRAVDRLGDERYKVALFGTRELEGMRPQIGHLERWVLRLPYQRFVDQLAPVVGAADLACVLQDGGHPVSRYQSPAKVFDALAMGVPCLVTPVPPLQPLIEAGVLNVFDGDPPLHERIAQIFEHHDEALDRARLGRAIFLDEYSYAAVGSRIGPVFEQLLDSCPDLSPTLRALVDVPRRLYPDDPSSRIGMTPKRVPGLRRGELSPGEQYDLVVFWKQNDTSIYGRRQDMFLKYLERSGRFRRIVHFDRPMALEALVVLAWRARRGRADERNLVLRQTLGRLLGRRNRGRIRHHTFVYAGRRTGRLRLPERTQYGAYVASVLERNGFGNRPTVFWVYPSNDDFPAIADAMEPDVIVADVVDDSRSWHAEGSREHDRIDRNYEEVLARSDVVLANCAPVAERMQRYAPQVEVVPNGCEPPGEAARGPRPKELRALKGPIIGYVGNLSSRLDTALLDEIVRARPDWHFVFVGSAHLDRSIVELDKEPNVHFVGVRPYAEMQRFLQHFDVALIPHLDDEMTRSMNPLKAFVYCSAGIPVVSTPIANIEELADLITVAHGPQAFLEAIEDALLVGRQIPDPEMLRRHSWERRVAAVIGLIDDARAEHAPRDEPVP